MKRVRFHSVAGEQEGSGFLMVLVLITVMSILIAAVLALYVAQHRFIRRDAHRLQARYAAEAGVYIAMDSLQQNPSWRAVEAVVDLPEGQTSHVTVEAFGGYVLIRSAAQYRRSRCTARALIGEVPPPSFENALQQWDGESGLHLAGTTAITGNIVVGRRGVKTKTFKRQRFTGRIRGAVFNVPDLQPPYFDSRFLQTAIEEAERYLRGASDPLLSDPKALPLARRLPSENRVYVASGDLRLTPADSLLLQEPMTVMAQGDLIVEGPIPLQPGTMLLAGKTLQIGKRVTGRDGLFFGREGLAITDTTRLSGQFFSRAYIRAAAAAYLAYPSVLYVTGERVVPDGSIVVEDGAVIDGTLIYPPMDPRPEVRRGRVRIQPAAQVRGAIFNAHETEFHGTLYGALLTRHFYFYESPTSYVNWLKDAVVNVEERPANYLLPLGFSPAPRLAVLRWDVFLEEAPRLP